MPRSGRKLYRDRAVKNAVKTFFSKIQSLQTLVIFCPRGVELPLVERVGGVEIPFSFLANSLKKIIIRRGINTEESLLANKAIWLLCFCPLLRQAILSINLTTKSESFLEEYHGAFRGLSRIVDLALEVYFAHVQSDRSTWWGLPWENRRSWRLKLESQTLSGTFHRL